MTIYNWYEVYQHRVIFVNQVLFLIYSVSEKPDQLLMVVMWKYEQIWEKKDMYEIISVAMAGFPTGLIKIKQMWRLQGNNKAHVWIFNIQ